MRRVGFSVFSAAGAAVLTMAVAVRSPAGARAAAVDADPPATTVRLVFVHHSSGENWLRDDNGGLGIALRDANYFVSDTNYGWGPWDVDLSGPIGDHTDLGNWYNWFLGSHRGTHVAALLAESAQHCDYSRLASNPGGGNTVVMFKSCFPNSNLDGSPADPPGEGDNPMRGRSAGDESYSVANAKGIYRDLLGYFATRQDVLWVVVTAPPLQAADTDAARAANARAFNTWLVTHWLEGYPHANVAVLDFYNVLTSNGGAWSINDLGTGTGNHHRVRNGAIEYVTDRGGDTSAYPEGGGDSHPSAAGNRKASAELVPVLNAAFNRWQASLLPPTPTPAPTAGTRPVRRRLLAGGG
jgi:hypothetical protein